MQNIKNVIFDLGGVILNLDFKKTFSAFEALSFKDFTPIFNKVYQYEFVSLYETGKISSEEFRKNLREVLEIDVEDQVLDAAWNAMLLDFPLKNIQFLQEIGKRKRIFVLSNTNDIHKTAAEKILEKEHPGITWDKLFEKSYFSHIMQDRKPNISIFKQVLNENGLLASETLFIDDSIQHVEGAQKAGLHALHLKDGMSITELGI
ncbi:HAD family hydrolase [Chondrinema litorale]|uniref:HAD family hydrolase n=1 Tax=Chondrinema litorale TaxID=2994555 RepID=UPI002542F4C0|nr:HAD family phosphatase [Chondrinema litorale]UZR95171.1 HAD family phosphatase [Chondrinema litorale]